MPLQSHRYQRSLQGLATAVASALLLVALPAGSGLAATTDAGAAAATVVCQGFDGCQSRGYSHQGYKTAKSKMYWNMYAGINCTNYVAYRMIQAGMPSARPAQLKSGKGNATYWGTSFGSDKTPMVGAIAWWKANTPGAGSAGHVAYVEQVNSPTDIVVSESNYGSEFDWRRITSKGPWPTGFIHLRDVTLKATALPTVVGTPKVGVTMRATSGTWSPTGSYSYWWTADGTGIPGATATTFTPTAAQAGKKIGLRVIASRSYYQSGTAFSAQTAPTALGTQQLVAAPAISGTAQVDQRLTVSAGSYAPAPERTAYQWLANGAPIPGATGTSYVPGQDQAGARLSVVVTAVRAGYTNLVTTTAATDPVLAPDITVAQPGGVEGPLLVGETLTADPGVLKPGDARATYLWMRDGQPMPAFTAQRYVVKPADIGRQISVRVQLSRPGYRSKSLVLGPVRGVKAPAGLTVKVATARPRQALIKVVVTAPDARVPTGRVWVKIQGKKRSVTLVRGVGKVRVTGLQPGSRALVAYYPGNERVTKVRTSTRVAVRRR